MIKLLGKRIMVSKVEEVESDGFQTVEVQESFVNKGKIETTGDLGTQTTFSIGAIILFAKYSPDTQEIDYEGKKYKIINVDDVLAIL